MKRFLFLLVVLAGIVAAASFSVSTNVARVNGVGISQGSLNADLTAISRSPAYQCYVQASEALASNGQATPPPESGAGGQNVAGTSSNGTYNTAFVSTLLNQRIQNQVIQELAVRHGAVLTAAILADGRERVVNQIDAVVQQAAQASNGQLNCGANGQQILASLPGSFVDEQVRTEAAIDFLFAQAGGYGLDPASLQRYFSAHRSQFVTDCVSVIVTPSVAAAAALRTQIAAGAPFAQVAMASSTDQASAANGGALGCASAAQINPPLNTVVAQLTVGHVSAPVSDNGQGLLVEVTSRTPGSLAAMQHGVTAAVISAGQQHGAALIQAALRSDRITVDPRYGTWSAGAATIATPLTPPPSSLLSLGADQPPAAPPLGSSLGSLPASPAG